MAVRFPLLVLGLARAVVVLALTGCAVTTSPRALHSTPPTERPDPASDCPSAASCFAAAMTAVDSGASSEGRERLLRLREEWPDSVWSARAAYWIGHLSLETDSAAAVEWGMRVSSELPIVGDHGLALAAEASQRAAHTERAAQLFDALVKLYPESLLAPRALAASAELWAAHDDGVEAAVARWRDLAARFPQHPLAPSSLLRMATVLEEHGRHADAEKAYRMLWMDHAASAEAATAGAALDRLVKAGVLSPFTVDERRLRAEALGRSRKHAEALSVWRALREEAHAPAVAAEIDRELGITLYRLRRWDDAWSTFRRLAKTAPPDRREEALLWEGRAAFRREDGAGLRHAETSLAAAFPSSVHRLELMALRAVWHRGRNELDAARARYRALVEVSRSLGRTDKAVAALWAIGWLDYRRGDLLRARETFEEGLKAAPASDPHTPQLLYWMARINLLSGAMEAARAQTADLVQRYPYTYYGYLARRTLPVDAQPAHQERDRLARPPADPPDDHGMPAWRAWSPRAAELWLMRLHEAAREELLAASRRAAIGPDRAMEIIEALAQVGAEDEALRIVRRHFAPALERGDAALPPSVWRRAYPTHLLTPIRARGADRVDPFLVAGLIREESVYDPRAVSPVGALGLMQLMPETARRMARAEGLADFTVEQLLTSEVNITLGIRYLSGLLERFVGNEAYAVAAYNAGPEAVIRWIESGPPRAIEEFIEEIPYQETRGYVKRVLRSKWRYETLYGPMPKDQVARTNF